MRIAGALVGILLLGGSVRAQESDRSQILDMYRQAFDAYDSGNMEMASSLFERIMHADPSEDLADSLDRFDIGLDRELQPGPRAGALGGRRSGRH